MSKQAWITIISPIAMGLAGWVVALAARYLPGHPIVDRTELTAAFLAGAVFVGAKLAIVVHNLTK